MAFSGTVTSDFLKLVTIPENKRADYIDYAATDFNTIRLRLIDYVKAVYPLEYNNFVESDLGMMLIELVAYTGAVLSMKADLNANENYLRTAKNRNNVKKLLELIGVNLRGPTGAAANTTLTLNSAATQPTVTIPVSKRVITISSPEDGAPLNFTLYKVSNGEIDTATPNSNIILSMAESDSAASSVWSNLALLEGALVVETGTFNQVESIKQVRLSQSPVVEKSVQVYLNSGGSDTSGAWTLVDNLYFASGATDKIYQMVYGDDLTATVLFGDGILGKSPPVNGSYTITYRIGGGTRGNINSEIINTQIVTDEGFTATIENSTQATGGRDAETIEQAKKYAPYSFKRQDRLVTPEDYSTFASIYIGATGSTGKARAVVRNAYSSANTIDIYLLQVANSSQLQQATVAYKKELLNAMNLKKMLTDELVIVDGLIRTLDLVVSIRVDKELKPKEEEVKGKTRDKILSFFGVDNFDFGKTFVLSDLAREIFDLDEVRFATVDNLSSDVQVEMNEIIQLNNFTINVIYV